MRDEKIVWDREGQRTLPPKGFREVYEPLLSDKVIWDMGGPRYFVRDIQPGLIGWTDVHE